MPKLSVIVPVYNVETYLPECIDSILDQSLSDLELILIDDGSPDKCGEICDNYAERDSRIQVIHQQNCGVSGARNAGLRIAAGEYIGFVDPDDFVSKEMYNSMICAAEGNGCELAICGFSNCTEGKDKLNDSPVPSGVYIREDLIASIYGMPNCFHGSMCNKVFSRKLLEGLFFDETVAIGEDWLLLYQCYLKAQKGAAISDCCYTVRLRGNSATRKRTAQLYLKKLDTYLRLYAYSKQHSKAIRKMAALKILDTCQLNKEAIIKDDYDRFSIAYVNRHFRHIAVKEFFRGNLSAKRGAYYFMKGLQF